MYIHTYAQLHTHTTTGDAFRAAFAVALSEGNPLETCLKLASAAGAIAVSRLGALPSLPSRSECDALCLKSFGGIEHLRGGGSDASFPLEFGSRLNSMKDRLDLWDGANDIFGWVKRQGGVKGLGLVDFNYPQHLSKANVDEVRAALSGAGLKAGAICMRYPKDMQVCFCLLMCACLLCILRRV